MKSEETSFSGLFTQVFENGLTVHRIEVPLIQRDYAQGRPDASYYKLRPGISGLWQVSRRNAGSFAERAHFDEDYSQRIGLSFDLEILWRTVWVVLRATGI